MIFPLVSKSKFPLLTNNKTLIYLDSAATTQKPKAVIDALTNFYERDNANVHRGIYKLSERATQKYENARETIAKFIHGTSDEIVFTRGATEGINLVAQSFVKSRLKKNNQIITTIAEHHSNFVPWQQLCKKTGAKFSVIPLCHPRLERPPRADHRDQGSIQNDNNEQWQVDFNELEKALDKPTALIAVFDISNVLGISSPIKQIVKLAHAKNVPVLLDAAQSIGHIPIDVQELDIDFLVASGHKMYGPMGIGFLWAKREYLEVMEPYQLGGDMIRSVSISDSSWNKIPYKFEAGTPNVAGAIALAAACDWLITIRNSDSPLWQRGVRGDLKNKKIPLNPPFLKREDLIRFHNQQLISYTLDRLAEIIGLTILGPTDPTKRFGLISFVIKGIHPHDLASILAEKNIAIRAGYHCAEPLHKYLNLPTGSSRISFGVYNSSEDIDRAVKAIREAVKIFK